MTQILKTYDFPVDHGDFTTTVELFYLKSEADKVIAELKKERGWLAKDRAQAYDDLEKRAQLNIKQEESIRHQKYKRCLAMAKWCYSMDCKMLDEAADNGTYFKESWCWKRALWYGKWKRKWLELAEKFKES